VINVDKGYTDLLYKIIDNGVIKENRTGTPTISIFSHTLEIDMSDGFPLLTTKKMFSKGIIHELLWFLNGDTNVKYLVDNGVNIWTPDAYKKFERLDWYDTGFDEMSKDKYSEKIKSDKDFADKWGELGPIYGHQWRKWNGNVDQIKDVIDKLRFNPDSRRIMVSAWNVSDLDKMTLPPCHWSFELYTEELTDEERIEWLNTHNVFVSKSQSNEDGTLTESGKKQLDKIIPKRKLSLKWHQRSVDTFLGLPFNIASYALLLEMFAQQCNMVPDKLIGDLTNVHIYTNHLEQSLEQIGRIPMKLCKLKLKKADDIFSYTFDDVQFLDYESHPPIKGKISV